MALDLDADLLLMMDTGDFAVVALFESVISGIPVSSASVKGHFLRDGQIILGTETHTIAFVCRAIDVPDAKHGDWITINNVKYNIVGTPFEADGESTLELEKA